MRRFMRMWVAPGRPGALGAGRSPVSVAGLAVALGFGPGALAAQETIASDRPGLDFHPAAVAPGVVQLELGPAIAYDGESGAEVWVVQTPSLLRVGVTPGFELRAGVSPFNSASFDAGQGAERVTDRGFGDLEIGAKLRLTDPDASGPAIALIPSLTLPTGDAPFTSDGVGALLNAVASFPIADGTSLAAVGGLYYTRAGEGDWDASGLAALVLGRALSEVVGGFVEVGAFPGGGADPVLVGGGLVFLVSPDVQLDVYLDRGTSDGAADWQFGAGTAFRF